MLAPEGFQSAPNLQPSVLLFFYDHQNLYSGWQANVTSLPNISLQKQK